MFDSPAAAADALLEWFDRPRVEIIVEALMPAIVLHPTAGKIVIGGTRLGGGPDVPQGFEWPRPPAPANPEEIAQRGNEYAAEEMRAHLALGLPYTFIGQIDLSEAARLGLVASGLPADGRLLFFYDNVIGPWETGTRPAKVIWERSPAESLATLALPEKLAAAASKEREQMAQIEAEFGDDDAATGERGTNHGAPARAFELRLSYRLPDPASLDFGKLADFNAASRDETSDPEIEDMFAAYEEALEVHHDRYPEESWRRQQLLGSPMPEQDDPRLDAVVVTEFGKQHLSREEWQEHRDAILDRARDWLLLLQVDLSDWMQAPFTEGSVYFLIRHDDLERRDFDAVVAVYQQT